MTSLSLLPTGPAAQALLQPYDPDVRMAGALRRSLLLMGVLVVGFGAMGTTLAQAVFIQRR